MDSVDKRFAMVNNHVHIGLRAGGWMAKGYEDLQWSIDLCVEDARCLQSDISQSRRYDEPTLAETLLDLEDMRDAMAYLREHLAVTPDGELVEVTR